MGCGSSAVTTDNEKRATENTAQKSKTTDNIKHLKSEPGTVSTLNYDDFKDIDEHARQTPKAAESSIQVLAEYLVKPAKNDVDKVRALYVWICENISYNTDAFFGGKTATLDTSAVGVLKNKSSVCSGYARLFESLCKEIGISCMNISGYAKGYGHTPGDVISFDMETNHAWNVVQLNGKWQFIETTWGAGHVDKNKKFVKKFSNFYFLTPPEYFKYDHFPYFDSNIEESNKWQLLASPITIETYSKMLKPSKEARSYGVKFTTHSNEYIKAEKSCTIELNATINVFQNVFYDLFDENGTLCNESVIILMETNKEAKIIVRPSQPMKYKLKLHATLCDVNTTLAEYIIDCVSTENDYQFYPKHRGYYGPQPDFSERGFEINGVAPFHKCKNGEFQLSLKTTSCPEVLVQLEDTDGEDNKDCTMIEKDKEWIHINARLSKKSHYKLTLFSKIGEKYTVAYTFLIRNEKESDTKSLFPMTYSSTQKFECKLLRPLVRDIPANSEITFEFRAPYFESVLVNKKVYTKENNDCWRITTTTGDSGDIKLSGQIPGEESFQTVYVFTIKS